MFILTKTAPVESFGSVGQRPFLHLPLKGSTPAGGEFIFPFEGIYITF